MVLIRFYIQPSYLPSIVCVASGGSITSEEYKFLDLCDMALAVLKSRLINWNYLWLPELGQLVL